MDENLSAGFNGLCSNSASAENSMKLETRTYKNMQVRCREAKIRQKEGEMKKKQNNPEM